MSIMYQQALSTALEVIINNALALNINGTDSLKALEEKTLTVLLTELGFPLSFTVNNEKILVTNLTSRSDCTINTSLQTFFKLKEQQQITQLIKQDLLDLQGDINLAQQFAGIAQTIDIDWQSEIAKHLGDIPTYKLSQLVRNFSKKAKFAKQQIEADASEWLVHEKRLVVTSSQINIFNENVNHLVQATDSLSARIEKLIEKSNSSTTNKDACE